MFFTNGLPGLLSTITQEFMVYVAVGVVRVTTSPQTLLLAYAYGQGYISAFHVLGLPDEQYGQMTIDYVLP